MNSTRGALSKGPPLFLLYLALQALVVADIPPGLWHDSPSYEKLNLLGAAPRLPTVPLLYTVFPTNDLRVWVQTFLAAVSWWVLASVASSLVRDVRVRWALRIVLLALGLASPVVNWNTTILSESVALSLTALLIATAINLQQRVDARSAGAFLAILLLWTFTRQAHVPMTLLVAVVLGVAAVLRRPGSRVVLAATAAGALLIAVAGLLEVQRNQSISRTNVGSIIQVRVFPNAGWTRWFEAHGMPYSRSIAAYAGTGFQYRNENRAYFNWIDEHGTATYLRFVLTHPVYTLIDPLPFFPGEQPSVTYPRGPHYSPLQPNPTPSLLSPIVDYGRHREVLPSVIDRLLFDQGEIGDVLALLIASVALAVYGRRRYGPDSRLVVPAVLVLGAIPFAYLVWLAGGEAVFELDRLSIITATELRVGLWIALFLGIDRVVEGRRARAE